MKRGTDLKLKFRLLKTAMGLRDWQVKGILQSIWDFTAENALAGDVGRFTDQEIAIGIDYAGDASQLIEVLINTHWLDRDPTHRLIIHQWREHCEEWIFKRIQRAGGTFADGSTTAQGRDQRRTTAADGGQRRTTAADGSLPGPYPGPYPGPEPTPEPYIENGSTHFLSDTLLTPKPREPSPIWDALVETCFPSLKGKKPTKPQASRIGKLVADLKALEADPAQIPVRWERCRQRFEGKGGPDALVKHWDLLAKDVVTAEPGRVRTGFDYDKAVAERNERSKKNV